MAQQRRNNQKAVVSVDARSIHDVPDDLLRLVLLRLDSPIWLLHAACACKRWRRIVTDGSADEGRAFLRLASSLHPPTVVGQYHDKGSGHTLSVPQPYSSPVDVNRFSVDFIDKISSWYVADCHGGLVLIRMGSLRNPAAVPNLKVYDPLARQHRQVSNPPSPLKNQAWSYYGSKGTFVLNGDDGNISLSNFRVLYLTNAATAAANLEACVFSTANGGEWNWCFLSGSADEDIFLHRCAYVAGYADGSLYLGFIMASDLGSRIVALGSTSLALSKVDLPTRLKTSSIFCAPSFTVVHGAADLVPTTLAARTSIVHVYGQKLELFCRVEASGEWVLEHTIANLSAATCALSMCLHKMFMEWITMASFTANGATFTILSARSPYSWSPDSSTNGHRWFFSLDVNTMELRVLPQEIYLDTNKIRNYTLPWPQLLRACPCS